MTLKVPTFVATRSPTGIRAHVLVICLVFGWTASGVPAAAGTPTSCESLTNFGHPDTTINSAQSQ